MFNVKLVSKNECHLCFVMKEKDELLHIWLFINKFDLKKF